MHKKKGLSICQGDVARNGTAIGLAVDKLGIRPSQAMVEQAVFQFFSLCLPRAQEVDSILGFKFACIASTHAHTCMGHS